MLVLLLGVELEILNEMAVRERDKLMIEAGRAYRDRGRCWTILGRTEAAQNDVKRAEQLEQDARKLTERTKEGQIELINRYSAPVTILIDGVAVRLGVGESKLIPKQPGPFRYEVPSTGQVSTGQLEAGTVFRIQIR